MAEIETVWRSTPPLMVAFEVLGGTFTSVINGVPVEIEFPSCRYHAGSDSVDLEAPNLKSTRPDVDWADYFDDHWPWGSIASYTRTSRCSGPGTAAISRVRVQFNEPRDGDNESILVAMESWWALVMGWTELFTGQDLQGDDSSAIVLGGFRNASPINRIDSSGSKRLPTSGEEILITLSGPTELAKPDVQDVLALAGRKEEPPLEWRLLASASGFARRDDYRRALLDAGTAAELAIERLIVAQYGRPLDNALELLLKRFQTLGGRRDLLVGLGGSVGDNFDQGLVTPRNKATHQGALLDPATANTAIGIARGTVEQAIPKESLRP